MQRTYDWPFPLPRTHTGILQGNGTLGAMVWGGGNTLRITLGRADFWDHRGGKPWTDEMSFANIRRLLEAGDEKGLRRIFEQAPPPPGQPPRPSILPVGRLELVFEPGTQLTVGTLDLASGQIAVGLRSADGREHRALLDMSMDEAALCVELPEGLAAPAIKRITSWDYVGEHLASISIERPAMFDGADLSGWVQKRPADPPLCVGFRKRGRELWIGLEYGEDAARSRAATGAVLDRAAAAGAAGLRRRAAQWWADYWRDVPRLQVPHERLAFLYDYGMYKLAGLTAPAGVAATLQGPWIEEYQMPPWSSDYHFNINVQMCYWPAYRGNRLGHLPRLFEMIWSWLPLLRDHARKFVGIDDGLMLPHAVDDRCTNMGGFWTGTIDHGCTAWVAKMMYDYWLYGGADEAFLRDRAYPFMAGAMRVYEAMLEKNRDGSYLLPVSVSPEYRGAALNAWGRNASFQLACIHWLAEALLHASEVLKIQPRPVWRSIQQSLPRACVQDGKIMLWEGTGLEESHRHHSHLAGITPFNVIDIDEAAWRPVVEQSIRHWVRMGMGMWSGWCMSWAAMIHTFVGNADAAELILEIWERVYTNVGHGTLHDCDFPGFTLIDGGPGRRGTKDHEIMQMDAGMGVAAAILEMMLHTRRGIHYLFAGAPARWGDVSFENIRTEGAFLVSASRHNGVVTSLRVKSERGGVFRYLSPWEGTVRQVTMSAGEVVEIR
jgi:hypothetical protein